MTDRPITKVEFGAMKGSLIYLATAYTKCGMGHDGAAGLAARIAARLALATDGAVFSPIAHGHALTSAAFLDPVKDSAAWGPLNDVILLHADMLVVVHMQGWEDSEGIAEEVALFEHARKPIFDMVDLDRLTMVRRQPRPVVRERIDHLPPEEIERLRQQFLEHRQS